ncbi:MAG: carboxypeptidase-like regulatory domain-containing protein [Thermoanaerobaculia bacterium]
MISCLGRFLLGVAALAVPSSSAVPGIAGRIVDPGDRPVTDVEIWVVPEDYAKMTPATVLAGPAAVTGSDGRFALRSRTVGDHERLRACRKGYKPVELPVRKPAATELRIVLTPTVHLAGHVVDADGTPLHGASVSASSSSGPRYYAFVTKEPPCYFPLVSSEITDAEGAFTLELGGAGHYEVSASGAAHPATHLSRLYVPPEGLDGLEIRMESGLTIQGHVADPDGHPIVGAQIRLSNTGSTASASSDDDGNFLLEGVATGEGSLTAKHDGFLDTFLRVQIRPEGTRIDLVLRPDPHLEIRGRVIGQDGTPVAGARLTDGYRSTLTLADGSFVLPGNPGSHELLAEKDGFATTETGNVVLKDRSIDGVEIRLSHTLTLAGRVLGIDAAAVGKISVSSNSPTTNREATVDSEGRFEIRDLPPREWTLSAQAGDRIALDRFTPPAGLAKVVVHDLQFPPVFEVRGRVIGPKGEPIEGASLELNGPNPAHFRARTLADGSFAVGVADGTYSLSVSAEGYSSRDTEQPIVIAGARVEGLEIQLGPNIVLTGRLLGLEPGETVQFIQAQGPRFARPGAWSTDDDAHYRQTGLWPGDWTIIAGYTSGPLLPTAPERLGRGTIHIPAGATEATLDLDFQLGDLTLTVRSAQPDAPFRASLLNEDGTELIGSSNRLLGGVVSQGGRVRFERLQAGHYRLQIEYASGTRATEQTIELASDREVVIDLPSTSPP